MLYNNTKFYQDAVIKHGVSPKGVHWNSKERQYKRFDVLISFILKYLKKSTIVDAGSGFGDILKYLNESRMFPKNYIGLDSEDFFIEISSLIYPDQTFLQKDILRDDIPKADYYICSGAMNIMEFHEMQLFIKKCFEASQKGFVFNFLVEKSFNKVDKDEILDYCRLLCDNIQTKDRYLNNDFTVFMVK